MVHGFAGNDGCLISSHKILEYEEDKPHCELKSFAMNS